MINVNDQDQMSALPIALENTDDLFGEDAVQGDEESVPAKNVQDADQKCRFYFIYLFICF